MSPRRLTRGNIFADILRDRRGPADVWIYVVQREGSADILAMGTCHTEDDAIQAATHAMAQFRTTAANAS